MPLVRRNADGCDICKRYRPQRISEVGGLAATKKSLTAAMGLGASRPKAYLFQGERGCGKTTMARIMAMGLNCEKGDTAEPCLECRNCKMALDGNAFHITEINMAQLNKKEDAEEIVRTMALTTMTGRNKVYIFDEAQMLTVQAQNLLLKNLEEPPKNTYIFICTTDPQKLIQTIHGRCEISKFITPTEKEIKEILNDVCEQENWDLPSDVDPNKFVEAVKGKSFREILKAVDQVVRGGLDALNFIDVDNPEFIDVCKRLVDGDFPAILSLFNRLKKAEGAIDWEGLRLSVLGYLRGVVYRDPHFKDKGLVCISAMECFMTPLYEARDAESRMVVSMYDACTRIKP